MEIMIAKWNNLTPETQLIIFDISKMTLLLIITLVCISKLRQWLIPTNLDKCFTFPPLDKKKPANRPTTWLSTSLVYGICLSIAGMIMNEFIMQRPLWATSQDDFLIKFWGTLLLYLLLMCLLKQFLVTLSELVKNPKIENIIEDYFAESAISNTRYQSIPLSTKLIHYSTFALYTGIAWIIGFLLVIELFDLQLFSTIIISLFISTGELFVALLMLFLGFKFYTQQEDKGVAHTKQSSLALVCCVLFGTLIIGGSSIVISSIPWLFLLIALWFFLMSPEKDKLLDFIAGIYLKLVSPIVDKELKNFQITRSGIFTTEIKHSTGEQEKIRNSQLLSICNSVDKEIREDSSKR